MNIIIIMRLYSFWLTSRFVAPFSWLPSGVALKHLPTTTVAAGPLVPWAPRVPWVADGCGRSQLGDRAGCHVGLGSLVPEPGSSDEKSGSKTGSAGPDSAGMAEARSCLRVGQSGAQRRHLAMHPT